MSNIPTIQVRIRRPGLPHARLLFDWPITEDPQALIGFLNRHGYYDEVTGVILTGLRGRYVTAHHTGEPRPVTYFEITANREEQL